MASESASAERSLAPGYRFLPTDVELLTDYLSKKAAGEFLPPHWPIREMALYGAEAVEPQQIFHLYGNNKEAHHQEEIQQADKSSPCAVVGDLYFFTIVRKKFKSGGKGKSNKINRIAGSGTWKSQRSRDVVHHGQVIGSKTILNFEKKGCTTLDSFIMHEYLLPPNSDSWKQETQWTVCRIRRGRSKNILNPNLGSPPVAPPPSFRSMLLDGEEELPSLDPNFYCNHASSSCVVGGGLAEKQTICESNMGSKKRARISSEDNPTSSPIAGSVDNNSQVPADDSEQNFSWYDLEELLSSQPSEDACGTSSSGNIIVPTLYDDHERHHLPSTAEDNPASPLENLFDNNFQVPGDLDQTLSYSVSEWEHLLSGPLEDARGTSDGVETVTSPIPLPPTLCGDHVPATTPTESLSAISKSNKRQRRPSLEDPAFKSLFIGKPK